MRKTILTATAIALVAGLAGAQERTRASIEANFWEPDVAGGIRVVEEGIGELIDLDGDSAKPGTNHQELAKKVRAGEFDAEFAMLKVADARWAYYDTDVSVDGTTETMGVGETANIDGTQVTIGTHEAQTDPQTTCPDWFVERIVAGASR